MELQIDAWTLCSYSMYIFGKVIFGNFCIYYFVVLSFTSYIYQFNLQMIISNEMLYFKNLIEYQFKWISV